MTEIQYKLEGSLLDSPVKSHEEQIVGHNDEKTMELILAAKNSDADKVKELISTGMNPNGRDEEGRTALHWALTLPCPCGDCARNAEACLMVLLKTCSLTEVNVQDIMGVTPLHIAAENQLEKCCKMLVYYGADVYACTNEGVLAITLISKRAPDVMVYLLDLSISLDGNFPTSERCSLSMDFRTLLGSRKKEKRWKGRGRGGGIAEMIDMPPDYYCSCYGKNEMHLLRSLLHSSKLTRTKIFTHPTVAIFLDQKWRRVRRLKEGSVRLRSIMGGLHGKLRVEYSTVSLGGPYGKEEFRH